MDGILSTIVGLLQPIVISLAAWGLSEFRKWVASKTQNEEINNIMQQISDAALIAVKAVYQTLIDAVRGKGGIQLSALDQKRAADRALAIMKNTLGPKTLEKIKELKGLDNLTLDSFLSSQIESAVYAEKQKRAQSISLSAQPLGAQVASE